ERCAGPRRAMVRFPRFIREVARQRTSGAIGALSAETEGTITPRRSGLWQVETEDCNVHWPARVSGKMEFTSEPRLLSVPLVRDIAGVGGSGRSNGFKRGSHFLRINEIHDGRLRVPPREV